MMLQSSKVRDAMAIERFLPIDILMDLCILCSVQLAFGRLRPLRLIASLAWMLGFTVFAYLGRPAPARLAAMLFPVCAVAAAILTGFKRPRRILPAAACIFAGSFAGAGLAAAMPGSRGMQIAASIGGIMLVSLLVRSRRPSRCRWNIEVYAELHGAHAEFPALIDTGNRLREPLSTLPVLIADTESILPLAEAAWRNCPEKIRHVRYGALGGGGSCPCFRPDRILMRLPGGNYVPAPECWIAIYPGRIPGHLSALAPPEFADAAGSRPARNQ